MAAFFLLGSSSFLSSMYEDFVAANAAMPDFKKIDPDLDEAGVADMMQMWLINNYRYYGGVDQLQSAVVDGPWIEPPRQCDHYKFCKSYVTRVPFGTMQPALCDICKFHTPHSLGEHWHGQKSCDACFPEIVNIINTSPLVRAHVLKRLRIGH